MARKTWIEKHWDEIVLYSLIGLSIYFFIKALGV